MQDLSYKSTIFNLILAKLILVASTQLVKH
jgi:hypothetical protein